MNYYEYAALLWAYLPYMTYAFVFLTLLPKSFGKIIKFASADYEANRQKYHRCYGPDLCCHSLADECESKPMKQRKAVTRVYPKRQRAPAPPTATSTADGDDSNETHIKRQVQASQIQTQVHVNQIAKMFENGGLGSRKINSVTPTTMLSEKHSALAEDDNQQQQLINIMKLHDMPTYLLQENLENSQNLLNGNYGQNNHNNNWSSESMATIRRNKRALPNTLSFAGTSATPSTASPAASSSPLSSSSPQHSRSPTPPTSPVQLRSAPLNLKTSVEDIFAAIARKAERNSEQSEQFLYVGCNTLSPVTCIDDILSERRLSRPLSAYSISDLLMNEENMRIDEYYVNALHCSLNESEA